MAANNQSNELRLFNALELSNRVNKRRKEAGKPAIKNCYEKVNFIMREKAGLFSDSDIVIEEMIAALNDATTEIESALLKQKTEYLKSKK